MVVWVCVDGDAVMLVVSFLRAIARSVGYGVYVGYGLAGDGIRTSPSIDSCSRSRGAQNLCFKYQPRKLRFKIFASELFCGMNLSGEGELRRKS